MEQRQHTSSGGRVYQFLLEKEIKNLSGLVDVNFDQSAGLSQANATAIATLVNQNPLEVQIGFGHQT